MTIESKLDLDDLAHGHPVAERELAELRAERDTTIYNLLNLLAVIHHDGGHYATKHGNAVASIRAEAVVLKDRAEVADLRERLERVEGALREHLCRKCEGLGYVERDGAVPCPEGCAPNSGDWIRRALTPSSGKVPVPFDQEEVVLPPPPERASPVGTDSSEVPDHTTCPEVRRVLAAVSCEGPEMMMRIVTEVLRLRAMGALSEGPTAAQTLVKPSPGDAAKELAEAFDNLLMYADGSQPNHCEGIVHHGCGQQGDEKCEVNGAIARAHAALARYRTLRTPPPSGEM